MRILCPTYVATYLRKIEWLIRRDPSSDRAVRPLTTAGAPVQALDGLPPQVRGRGLLPHLLIDDVPYLHSPAEYPPPERPRRVFDFGLTRLRPWPCSLRAKPWQWYTPSTAQSTVVPLARFCRRLGTRMDRHCATPVTPS